MNFNSKGMYLKHELCPRCGKVCFDKRSAQTKKNELLRKGNERFMRIYQCGIYWHLTSSVDRMKDINSTNE